MYDPSKGVVPAGAEPERVKKEIEDVVGLDCKDALLASAKQVSPRLLCAPQCVPAWPFRLAGGGTGLPQWGCQKRWMDKVWAGVRAHAGQTAC